MMTPMYYIIYNEMTEIRDKFEKHDFWKIE